MLASFAAVEGSTFEPVQVQKFLFLIDENLANELGGKKFQFRPYDYGPFDHMVYRILENLASRGLAIIEFGHHGRRTFRLSAAGQHEGAALLRRMPQEIQIKISHASNWVRALSFSDLVAAIYRMYPEMRANSVFRD